MEYETVIGLEVHAQLLTKSKMFCSCSTAYQDASPNSHVCPVCLGMPGMLPVINRKAIEYIVMTGLALNCTINAHSKFDRKNYPYPDLMKGFQISQYDLPLCSNGYLTIEVDGQVKKPGITRVHMEEDTARLSHHDEGAETYSLVDVNRGGIPLMEIVGEPDLRSAEEARQYLIKLHQTLRYLGISSGNMEEGAFRCDANVSIRPKGSTTFGKRVEVKNMNSFRSVFHAIEYEVARQIELTEAGQRIIQETRGWVDNRGITVSQRSKEAANDYRYFPEPDLPPMELDPEWVASIKSLLPELPDAKSARFMSEYGLSQYDAEVLTATKSMSRFFEDAVRSSGSKNGATQPRAKAIANWCTGELMRLLNLNNREIDDAQISAAGLSQLIDLLDAGEINQTAAKTVFEDMFTTGHAPRDIVQERGLGQISGADALGDAVDKVLAANPQAIQDFKNGKEAAIGFLVGNIMKETKGRANPGVVTKLLREKLAAS